MPLQLAAEQPTQLPKDRTGQRWDSIKISEAPTLQSQVQLART